MLKCMKPLKITLLGCLQARVSIFGCHNVIFVPLWITMCRSLSLGLVTKARICKGAGQEWSLGVTFHVPRSVGECEGMNLHTLKWAPTLGVGSPDGFPNFQRAISGVKTNWTEFFFISLKSCWNLDV